MRALVARVGDGTIPAADVYRVYCEMMTEQKRPTATQRALGTALRDAHQRSTVKYVDRKNVRSWVIRQRFLEWLTPEPDESDQF